MQVLLRAFVVWVFLCLSRKRITTRNLPPGGKRGEERGSAFFKGKGDEEKRKKSLVTSSDLDSDRTAREQ